MPRIRRSALVVLAGLLLAGGACSSDDDDGGDTPATSAPTESAAGTDPLPPLPDDVALPIVFVHGFAGSAQQYESQAMRFVANGYPAERIVAYDHDGAGVDLDAYVDGLDEVVDRTLDDTGADQVFLVGHSRGTTVSSMYLDDPDRAAKVAKYVAVDGQPCVDVVPCLAPTQETNPGQAHVEVATSPESFAAQYEFLVGEPPEVVEIVPQREPVVLEGRAVNFPANTGREGANLEIWEVDPATGARVGEEPVAGFTLGADGAWGPVEVESGAHHEFVLSAPDTEVQHHLYLQPYVRSSHLVRLLSSEPDGPTRSNTNVGDGHTSVIAIRMREWYAEDDPDLPGDQADRLELSVDGSEPVDALEPFVGNEAIGLHLHDDAATPGETTLDPLPYFADQPFQSGVDVYLPASESADGVITVTNIPRGDDARPQVLNVPNWPSSGHAVSVVFTDHPVD
ncbi:MAG TPA: alpha/beta fold hydrolase [Acidimicrobiales bacterium]|nr:alpha/beta fold hydrolase [Acidimicrobiales bacterium]